MKSKNIEFTGALGDNLTARLDSAEDESVGFALFAHCFTCSKNLKVSGILPNSWLTGAFPH